MFMSKPLHFFAIACPMRPMPMMAIVLPVISSPKNGRYGCQNPHRFSRTSLSAVHSRRDNAASAKNANSAVASVSTSGVCV